MIRRHFIGGIILLNKSKDTKPMMDRIKLKLPIVGDIFFKSAMARSNRTLASLVESGVPIPKSLEMTAEVSDNAVIAGGYTALRDAAQTLRSRGHKGAAELLMGERAAAAYRR